MRRNQHHPTIWHSIAIGLTVLTTAVSLLALSATPITARGQQNIQCNTTYVVQAGDDLFRLSLKYNVSIAALQSVNNISDANLIFIGQSLCIPAGNAPASNTPVPLSGYSPTVVPNATSQVGDVGTEPPVDAIGNFLEICTICSAKDINATQLQYRQGQSVCASVKPFENSGAVAWYRVNRAWCAWYHFF